TSSDYDGRTVVCFPYDHLSSSSILSLSSHTWVLLCPQTCHSSSVDCQVQFVPRYVQKPLAMYTFLCDLDVPRRSFGYHCRLHCDALAQADYWLEQRCPLAYLGCPFSIVRLRPNLPDASVPDVSPTASNAGSSKVNFNDLPTEILLQISHYLDEISLIILSKVSERLASFCLSLLPSRGIVAPVWRRRDAAWRIANFVWTLPFKGEKVRRCAHLATCPFYEVVRMEAPFRLLNCPEKLPFTDSEWRGHTSKCFYSFVCP
ncbi:unnamed protein product, partial [Schistocephalus solidus]|uniref:F-box domain-containing protein n=1 Tax=Schistocephalus solidus TaxID=70667 RepID=A0A183TDV4_SCHSO